MQSEELDGYPKFRGLTLMAMTTLMVTMTIMTPMMMSQDRHLMTAECLTSITGHRLRSLPPDLTGHGSLSSPSLQLFSALELLSPYEDLSDQHKGCLATGTSTSLAVSPYPTKWAVGCQQLASGRGIERPSSYETNWNIALYDAQRGDDCHKSARFRQQKA